MEIWIGHCLVVIPPAKGLSRQPLHCHALWQSTSWLFSWVGGWESSCTSFFASSLQNSQFTDSISPIRAWDCIGWPWFILCYLVLIHANLSYALDNHLLIGGYIMHADKYFNLYETIRSTDRLLQVTWVPFRLFPSPTVTVSCEWNLALWTLLGFLMALTSVAVKPPLDILTVCELGRNEMGSLDGIWFPAIHWRATSSDTLQVKITVSPGQAACLPAYCTLEVRVTWAIECWKYSCMYETENYSNEHRIYNYNLAHNFWLIFS